MLATEERPAPDVIPVTVTLPSEVADSPQVMLVPVERLKVDRSYQRALKNIKLLQRMTKRWDPTLARVIDVSQRENGDLYVIDGQHRMEGAKRAGIPYLQAHVWKGLTVEQEAARFRALNDKTASKPTTAVEDFIAGLAENNPWHTTIKASVELVGLHLNLDHPKMAPGEINAPDALIKGYVLGVKESDDEFIESLRLIAAAFGDADDGVPHPIVRGVPHFWHKHRTTILKYGTYDDFIRRLRLKGIEDITRRLYAKHRVNGMTVYRAAMEVLEEIHDANKRSNRLVPKRTHDED